MALTCLQIHNDYQIPGGETKTAVGIADVLEKNGIKVIKYYKTNESFKNSSTFSRVKVGIKSVYNQITVEEIQKIIDENKIDFALVHNVIPVISNSVYSVLENNNVPIIKYIQNYNLICLNGSVDCGDSCVKCKNNNMVGVVNKCYKNSYVFSLIKYIIKQDFDRNHYKHISAFMPNSAFVKNRHIQFGIDSKRMYVMYNYIQLAEKIENIGRYDYYLYFGRISPEKGIYTIVDASKLLPNLNFVFMGTGEETDKLQDEVSSLNNVSYIGGKSGDDMMQVVKNAKAVIVSSEWDEPLPRTIMESYSVGTPIIGANRGGIPEMIHNGIGLIYEAGDVHDLVNKINIMESLSEVEYLEMRKACLEEVINNYTEEKYYNRFLSCLKDINAL